MALHQGVRRIVAFTGLAAEKAIAEGVQLSAKLAAASELTGDALEAEVNTLKVQVDTLVIPAFERSELRKTVTSLLGKVGIQTICTLADGSLLGWVSQGVLGATELRRGLSRVRVVRKNKSQHV